MTQTAKCITFDGFSWDLLLPSNIDSELDAGIPWEPVTTRWIKDTLKPGMTAVDVGANIGWFTLQMARAVSPQGQVWAFEPCQDFFWRMINHVALNRLNNVYSFNVALSDKSGPVRLVKNLPPYESSATVTSDPSGVPVAAHLLDEFPLTRCDLIKIDVDGHEYQVIQGARKTIETFRPAMVIEINGETGPLCLDFLCELKYLMRPEEVTPWREVNEVLQKIKLGRPTVNVIAMPKEKT